MRSSRDSISLSKFIEVSMRQGQRFRVLCSGRACVPLFLNPRSPSDRRAVPQILPAGSFRKGAIACPHHSPVRAIGGTRYGFCFLAFEPFGGLVALRGFGVLLRGNSFSNSCVCALSIGSRVHTRTPLISVITEAAGGHGNS